MLHKMIINYDIKNKLIHQLYHPRKQGSPSNPGDVSVVAEVSHLQGGSVHPRGWAFGGH